MLLEVHISYDEIEEFTGKTQDEIEREEYNIDCLIQDVFEEHFTKIDVCAESGFFSSITLTNESGYEVPVSFGLHEKIDAACEAAYSRIKEEI